MVSQGPNIFVFYLQEFVAKTKSERNPLPRSIIITSLSESVGDLPEERLLCLVCAVRVYLDATSSATPHPRSLFVSPHCPLRALSKNALLFFLRQVISDAGAIWDISAVTRRAHSVRDVATSAALLRNWLVAKVLEAAAWASNPVFSSFYFKDLSFTLDDCSFPFHCWGLGCFMGFLLRSFRVRLSLSCPWSYSYS